MIKETNIRIRPNYINNPEKIKEYLSKKLEVKEKDITDFKILKRSIDARSRNIVFQLKVQVGIQEKIPKTNFELLKKINIEKAKPVIVVGAGPAGLFAAIELIQHGLKEGKMSEIVEEI